MDGKLVLNFFVACLFDGHENEMMCMACIRGYIELNTCAMLFSHHQVNTMEQKSPLSHPNMPGLLIVHQA